MWELHDRVYGHFVLPEYCHDITKNEWWGRLTRLSQLALKGVYRMDANHTRAQHSLGVAFLTNRLLARLLSDDKNEHLVRLGTIAGLCHDIGHGPFSHLFEQLLDDVGWSHETVGVRILRERLFPALSDTLNLSELDIDIICQLIFGERELYERDTGCIWKDDIPGVPAWFFTVLSNATVDTDRLDYLARDLLALKGKRFFDACFLIDHIVISDDESQFGFTASVFEEVASTFSARIELYRCCNQSDARLVEFAALEHMRQTVAEFHHDCQTFDLDTFRHMTDDFVLSLWLRDNPTAYRQVACNAHTFRKVFKLIVTPERVSQVRTWFASSFPGDLSMSAGKVSYGKTGAKNPMSCIAWFDDKTRLATKVDMRSNIQPFIFEEFVFVVGVDATDAKAVESAQRCLAALMEHFDVSSVPSTKTISI